MISAWTELMMNLLAWFFIGYAVVLNTSFGILTLLAISSYLGYQRRIGFAGYDESFGEPLARGVSVLMPAYNESATIVESVSAMTALRYPDFEVIVIDDGSKDDTVARMIEAFDLVQVPLVVTNAVEVKGEVLSTWVSRRGAMNLLLVCKANGGKADALNVGINAARKELVCMVDADSLLEPEALLHVSRPFADDPGRVVASGGVVRIVNGSRVTKGRVANVRMPDKWLPRIQVVEYLRAFMIGRAGWSRAGGLLIISGAFGVFRRDILRVLNGVETETIGEDAELVVRMHRWLGDHDVDANVVFVSEPVSWTEAPDTLGILHKQRRRWHRGLTEVFARHWTMMGRPRYGVIGMVTMPWFFVFELLAPFVELFGVAYLAVVLTLLLLESASVPIDIVDWPIVLLMLAVAILYSVFMSLLALLGEELSFRRYSGVKNLLPAIAASVVENIGYRQLTAWWRVQGTVDALRHRRHEWGDMQRRGFDGDQ